MLLPEVPLKTVIDVARIRRACRIVETILAELPSLMIPGVSTKRIDSFCSARISKNRVDSAIKGYKDFPGNVCISVNNVAAHGVPDSYTLCEGDVVSVDIAVMTDGWYGDGAWTYVVGKPKKDVIRLLKATWQAVAEGIDNARPGKRFGDIGYAIQERAASFGCSVLGDFVGHGIGKELHEEPKVLNFGDKNTGMIIVPGMVFTIEPIITLGAAEVKHLGNNWSFITADGSVSAQFEHTVAVFKERTEILTFSQNDIRKHVDFPPYF